MDKEEEFKTIEILNGLVYCNTAKKYIPKNILTIADAKRSDIGNTAKKYAETQIKETEEQKLKIVAGIFQQLERIANALEESNKFHGVHEQK